MTDTLIPRRAPNGHWLPGQSANPSGRPKKVEQIADLAQQHAPEAFAKIVAFISHSDPKIALAAAIHVLDRAFGKPSQSAQVEVAKWDMSKLWLEVVKSAPGLASPEPKTIDASPITPPIAAPAATLPIEGGDDVTTTEW